MILNPKYKNITITSTLFVLLLVMSAFFFYSHGNIATDTGREAMIPLALLKGKVLYRDVLNIYGPLAYYINAFVYKILGIKIQSLYIAGTICSIVFLLTINRICLKFFQNGLSFLITLFVALSCVYNTRLFNFIFPYSYSAVYGLTFYTIGLFLLIQYTENKKTELLYTASLFAGAAFACKIEFAFLFLLTLIVSKIFIKNSFKTILIQIILFLLFPFFSYSIPFIQGLSFKEAAEAVNIFIKSSCVPSVIDFAKQTGTSFAMCDLYFWAVGFLFLSVFVLISFLLMKIAKSHVQLAIFCVFAAFIHFFLHPEMHFSFLALLIVLFLFISYKKLLKNPKIAILLLGASGASLRVMFNVNTNEYGAYSFPLLFISLIAIIFLYKSFFENKFVLNLDKFLIFVISAGIISNFVYSMLQLRMYSAPIITERGRIDTIKSWKIGADKIINFIKNDTNEDDKVLILPEGCIFNFLSGRETDMRLYALNQPYIETYGEFKITEMIKTSNFKYIVIIDGFGLYNFTKSRYYFYENLITKFIQNNYKIVLQDKTLEYEVIILERI